MHVPKYLFSLPTYFEQFLDYKFTIFYYHKIKKQNVQFFSPSKPLSPKFYATHLPVDEFVLEDVAKANGFKIVDEKLYSLKSVYTLELSSS